MSAERTPGPWEADGVFIVADGITIASVRYNDAPFIATACNAVDELAAALKPFANLGVCSGPDDELETYRIYRGAILRARAALAKLEGKA